MDRNPGYKIGATTEKMRASERGRTATEREARELGRTTTGPDSSTKTCRLLKKSR